MCGAFYEVVRSGMFWENTLRNKLCRYKNVFDNFEGNNWKLTEPPALVMVGEDFRHCLIIDAIAKEIGIEVLFTDDLMFCGKNFYNSIYTIENGQRKFFAFDTNSSAAS